MTTPPDTPKLPAELWVVIDDVGQPEYAASYPEAAQEHINDWIENASDSTVKILGLGKYSSHRYILAPSPQESHKLAEELERDAKYWRGHGLVGVTGLMERAAAALRSSEQTSDARDAGRYRWLRANAKTNASICLLDENEDGSTETFYEYTSENIDAAIDAAIAASGGAKGDGNG